MNKLLLLYEKEELENFFTSGKIMVLSYRRCGELKRVPTNESGFGIVEYEREYKRTGLPYVTRGRHIFTTIEHTRGIVA